MPKNPALVPTIVTDKNGRVTTVHRKPAGTTKKSRIPAPVVKAEQYKKRAVDALDKMEIAYPTDLDSPEVKTLTFLAQEHPRLLNDIVERVSSCGDTEWMMWSTHLRRKTISESKDPMANDYPLFELRARLELFEVAEHISRTQSVSRQTPAGIDFGMARAIEKSYEQKLDWHMAKVSMIMESFIAGDANDIRDATFTPEIYNRLPRLLEVLPEMRKRGAATTDTIIMLMDSDSGVLIDGEL